MGGGVVVTGASTGIGKACAVALANNGFTVVGTVRSERDADVLKALGVTPVTMDVTDAASISAARHTVNESLGETKLVALVNNAGVMGAGPLEHIPLDDMRRVYEVNVIGTVAVTQAFLPALKLSGGRIVNMSSVSGFIAPPFLGPYTASKFALEAVSDSLRRELVTQGVDVIVIEPGSVDTPIWDKAAQLDTGPFRGTLYEKVLDEVRSSAIAGGKAGIPTSVVAAAVVRALTVRRPPARIRVVKRPLRTSLMRMMPERLVDRMIARRLWGSAKHEI